MATIEQYKSGKAAKAVRLAYETMQVVEKRLPENCFYWNMEKCGMNASKGVKSNGARPGHSLPR
jgi:hypothetical protein